MTDSDSNTAAVPRNEGPEPRRSGESAPAARRDDDCLEASLRRFALELGFAACAVAGVDDLTCGPLLAEWLAAGRHGDMNWLAEKHERRLRPQTALAGARAAVVVAWPYAWPLAPDPRWREELRGRVAAYAIGEDYHAHVAERLAKLASWLAGETGAESVVHVDGGPLVEKELARRAGLGWYGRNTNLIRPGLGSTFVLGVLVTQAPLVPDPPFAADHCGTCRACIPACPTGALDSGPTIDARLCLSYLTIEHRGPIPPALRPSLANWVFGCDLCQEVCPWNEETGDADPRSRPWLPAWLAMGDEEFRESFAGTAMLRPKRRGLARNAAVALGNTGNPEAAPWVLRAVRTHDEPLVRAHAAWAAGRLAAPGSLAELEAALAVERIPPVQREIEAAIAALRGARAAGTAV